ncbi:MAG: zinc dependent phospholipase C family protein [Lachnospiraceae bacterium]|nr:zinc dependent phospholipase C family protein [Lachnospiraceae bacterium]
MRKKSHIRLARFIVAHTVYREFIRYRKSYYLGSILPDCTPSFITTKHNIDETFPMLKGEIRSLTRHQNQEEFSDRYFTRHLGEVLHYLADYFTYPHNSIFTGNLKVHCSYEKQLKHRLREFLNSPDAVKTISNQIRPLNNTEEIIEYIVCRHRDYLKCEPSVENDCRYILETCFTVSEAIARLYSRQPQLAFAA